MAQASTLPDGEMDRAALLTYFESNPQFELSGEADDGSVWARFTDGRLVIIRPPIPKLSEGEATLPPSSDLTSPGVSYAPPAVPVTAAPDSPQEGKAVAVARQQEGRKDNLPASDKAVVMSALGAYSGNAPSVVSKWLTDNGYPSQPAPATVESLKAVQDVGVFYFYTHGGSGCLGTFEACKAKYTPAAPGAPTAATPQVAYTYALWTSTPVSKANDATFKADLDGKFLAYSYADSFDVKDKEDLQWRYAITDTFVVKYMLFSQDSLVFINACSSMASTLPKALRTAKASVAVGWSDVAEPLDRPQYFFDRLLGGKYDDGVAAYQEIPNPEPPNRPFDVDSIWQAMQAHHQTPIIFDHKGTTYTTHLEVLHLRDSFSILRPSIESVFAHEDKSQLEIWGIFGDRQGDVTVTIGGTEVAIETWENFKIIVTLPAADKPGGSGNVVVKVRKHESNAVPLTLWRVKFTYTEGPVEPVGAMENLYLDLYWRADVHRWRSGPDGEVHDQDPIKLVPADASSGSWDCDWHGSYGAFTFTTEVGQGELPFTREKGPIGFTSEAKIDAKEHTISHLEFVMNLDKENTCVVRTAGGGVSGTQGYGFLFLPSLLDEIIPDMPVTGPLTLDKSWTLTAGNRALIQDGQWPYLKWEDTKPQEDTEPKYAPDPKETEA